MKKISDQKWIELEKLLNLVADERDEDRDGPGSWPSHNADQACEMLTKLRMERRQKS